MICVIKRTLLLVSFASLVLSGCRGSSSKKGQPANERNAQAPAKHDQAVTKASSQAILQLETSTLKFQTLGSDCQAIAFDKVNESTTLGEVANYYKSRAQRKDYKCTKSSQGFDCEVEYANNQSEDTEFFVRMSFQLSPSDELVASSVTCVLAG